MTPCPNCGRPNADDARFCSNCGHALVTRVGIEERRHVTALFADLVASTSLSDRLDPEVVRGVVSQFFERSITEIRRFGGTAEQFRGDAIMALFGLQQAHEDDPERAVRAAFAVREASPRSRRTRSSGTASSFSCGSGSRPARWSWAIHSAARRWPPATS